MKPEIKDLKTYIDRVHEIYEYMKTGSPDKVQIEWNEDEYGGDLFTIIVDSSEKVIIRSWTRGAGYVEYRLNSSTDKVDGYSAKYAIDIRVSDYVGDNEITKILSNVKRKNKKVTFWNKLGLYKHEIDVVYYNTYWSKRIGTRFPD